jgi:hypothetical protein
MTAEDILAALHIPPEALVNQRIAKKLLLENGAPTAADKKIINEGIEELLWIAALKPTTIGVPEYKDAESEVLEIAVLRLVLRNTARWARITELVHRAIPYPVFLVTEKSNITTISFADKRWAQNEGDKTVLDGDIIDTCKLSHHGEEFLTSIAISRQKKTDLRALYRGWTALAEAYRAAQVTGIFNPRDKEEDRESRANALLEYDKTERELAVLKTEAGRTTQMNRRVELNIHIKELEAKISEMKTRMR